MSWLNAEDREQQARTAVCKRNKIAARRFYSELTEYSSPDQAQSFKLRLIQQDLSPASKTTFKCGLCNRLRCKFWASPTEIG